MSSIDSKPDDVNSLILGKWKDENSTFEILKDGNMQIRWDNGQTAFGKWKISDGQLKFSINNSNYEYFILELTANKLMFELVKDEKEKYVAIKQTN